MSKKPGFTLEQHKVAGAKLSRIVRELEAIRSATRQAYRIDSFDRQMNRAIGCALIICNDLENAMFSEAHEGAHTAVYYAGDCHQEELFDRAL